MQEIVDMDDIRSELSLCFEIRYVDFTGISHVEWYYADYFTGGILLHIDENFQTPLQIYTNAERVDMNDLDDESLLSSVAIDFMSQLIGDY